jgi:hypothetical protein
VSSVLEALATPLPSPPHQLPAAICVRRPERHYFRIPKTRTTLIRRNGYRRSGSRGRRHCPRCFCASSSIGPDRTHRPGAPAQDSPASNPVVDDHVVTAPNRRHGLPHSRRGCSDHACAAIQRLRLDPPRQAAGDAPWSARAHQTRRSRRVSRRSGRAGRREGAVTSIGILGARELAHVEVADRLSACANGRTRFPLRRGEREQPRAARRGRAGRRVRRDAKRRRGVQAPSSRDPAEGAAALINGPSASAKAPGAN